MSRKQIEQKTLVFLYPTDEKSMIREHIAKEEGLSPEEALRHYSDSMLIALLVADPDTYTAWAEAAYLSLCNA